MLILGQFRPIWRYLGQMQIISKYAPVSAFINLYLNAKFEKQKISIFLKVNKCK